MFYAAQAHENTLYISATQFLRTFLHVLRQFQSETSREWH